ncbi:MAG: AAA family ATPase [Muribaculum sp.]|nr:AAA family ATPase [Muribaculum sp.]
MPYQEEYEDGLEYAAEPEAVLQINRELTLARRIVEETGTNLFLTGKAGTGKTTFLHRLMEDSAKRMVVLAPTGVAAINAGGMTIHSFFQLPFSPFVPGRGFVGEEKHFLRIGKEKRRLIASLDLIVIDEISMVRPDTLDGIDSILRRQRGIDAPFGGVQLLLIGDLRQLAPVVRTDEWEMLSPHYSSPYFFESKALREAGFVAVELKHIYRQQDPEFISLLNAVRDGRADYNTLGCLNSRFRPIQDENWNHYIRLTTHNRTSDEVNLRRLAALNSAPVSFEATVTGKFPESSFPADKILTLKEGARVMFIKNDTGAERRYYNGLIGTVVEMDEDTVTVQPDDENLTAVKTGAVQWENTSYSINEDTKEVSQHVDGSFSQIPLRLAWAITIHKSQGLTFDNAIIDASHSFAPGQLYVALSRCRSLEGMILENPLSPSAVIIDRVVNSFIESAERNAPDDSMVDRLRNEYFRSILADLFNFRTLTTAFSDFKRAIEEFVAPMYPDLYGKYREAEQTFRSKIDSVGLRFITLYASRPMDATAVAADKAFIEKVRGGCNYFLEQLAPICKLLNDTPLEVDNTSMQRRLDNVADALMLEMAIKKTILTGMLSDTFSPEAYMKYKAHAVLSVGEEQKKRAKVTGKKLQKDKSKKERKTKGYSQRETLKLWRSGLNIEEIAEKRGFVAGTIAMHLVDMVRLDEIQLSDILPADTEASIKAICDRNRSSADDYNFSALREQVAAAGIPSYLFSIYHQFHPFRTKS